MRILYVYADELKGKGSYCSTWTCIYPAYGLDRAGIPVGLIDTETFVAQRPIADIIVVERLLWNGSDDKYWSSLPTSPKRESIKHFTQLRVLDTIRFCQEKGSRVIGVFDDHYEAYPKVDESEITRILWQDGVLHGTGLGFRPMDDFQQGLGVVDAVMVPSMFLAGHYGKYAKKMYHVHNRPLLHGGRWPVSEKVRENKFVIGWSGTAQHLPTWEGNEPLLEALTILKDRIVIRGVVPPTIEGILTSRGIRVDNSPSVNIEWFPNVVASYDIGICPLHGEYDKGRSWIKWLECSLMGKPVIAANLADVYSECRGGFVVDGYDSRQWVAAIEMLTSQEIYRTKSNEGRAWAWAQGWDENIFELLSVFEEVL